MVITVDPGDTTGIAYWTDKGELIEKEMLDFDALIERIEALEGVTVIVCEDYRLRQGKQMVQTGSKFQAVQVIGALKAYAKRHKAKMVLQDASVLTVAALHSGVKRPSDHSKSHAVDAYNHGYYYFETKGLLQPKPL
jgi:predicted RNase H-like nuclease (RuvC/YqgF family)